jgi:hypothetical protein
MDKKFYNIEPWIKKKIKVETTLKSGTNLIKKFTLVKLDTLLGKLQCHTHSYTRT